jgi:hypothetical protein
VLCSSLLEHDGVLTAEKSIKLSPERSVLAYELGSPIALTKQDFDRVSAAFFTELERRYCRPAA